MLYEINEYKNVANGLLEKIEKAIYTVISPLDIDIYTTEEPVAYKDRFIGEKKKGVIGESWGKLWQCAWFNFKGNVPKEVEGKNIVALIDISGEAFVVNNEGTPIKGLTTLSSEFDFTLGKPGKREIELINSSKGGEQINIWADCACNDLFGKYQNNGIVKDAYIAICNEEVKKLYFDIEVLVELLNELSEDSARYHRILNSFLQ